METQDVIRLEMTTADLDLIAESDNQIENTDADAPSLDSGDPTKVPK